MNFNIGSQSASKSLFGGTPNPSGGTAAANTGGFNFGSSTPVQSGGGGGGFSFGATKPIPTQSAGAQSGFSFGTAAGTTAASISSASTGLSFGTPAGTPAASISSASTGLSLGTAAGTPAASISSASTGLSFGTPASTTAASTSSASTGLSLGTAAGTTAASTAPVTGITFGTPTTKTSAPQSNFGGTTSKTTGFSLGGSTPSKPAGQGLTLGSRLATTSTAPTPSTGLNFGGIGAAKQVAATGASTVGIAPLASKPVSLGAGQATKPGLSLGGLSSTVPATKSGGVLGEGAKTSGAPGLTLSLGKTATGSSTASATSNPTGPTMNYRELEESINKWTVELEEQEKIFLQQATQVNGWDRLLVENGEKITSLHNDVEKVKTDQQRLEHELDYIVAQQRELEDMLAPLEETIKTQQGSIFTQHADVEREHTYQLAETIDSQLKRMVQDLKEVIEHLNTSNTAGEANDPIHQIAKILNAHMDSLQWIDHNTAMCQRKVDEITRQSEIVRRDQERNVQLAFD